MRAGPFLVGTQPVIAAERHARRRRGRLPRRGGADRARSSRCARPTAARRSRASPSPTCRPPTTTRCARSRCRRSTSTRTGRSTRRGTTAASAPAARRTTSCSRRRRTALTWTRADAACTRSGTARSSPASRPIPPHPGHLALVYAYYHGGCSRRALPARDRLHAVARRREDVDDAAAARRAADARRPGCRAPRAAGWSATTSPSSFAGDRVVPVFALATSPLTGALPRGRSSRRRYGRSGSASASARSVSPAPASIVDRRARVERRRAAVDDRERCRRPRASRAAGRRPGRPRATSRRRASAPASRASCVARAIAASGSSSPNMTTSGLSTRPQLGHARHGQQRDDLGERHDGAAVEAARRADRAVHLDERARAGALVQPVDVLRDHRAHPAALLELGERAVAVVRLGVAPSIASRLP